MTINSYTDRLRRGDAIQADNNRFGGDKSTAVAARAAGCRVAPAKPPAPPGLADQRSAGK
jgi:hypothetical protein